MTGLLVALDLPDPTQAENLAATLLPHVSGFKVGLELLLSGEPHGLEKIVELGLPVFADAKLHDIPATVKRSAYQLGKRGARWVTVHLSGGKDMIEAAVTGLSSGGTGQVGILGVSVLTSLGDDDLISVGVSHTLAEQVRSLLDIGDAGGAEGVICSVHEVSLVRESKPGLLTFTPGIRADGSSSDDQKRVATLSAAKKAGPDYVVVGRPITAAADPIAAAAALTAELAAPMN